MDRGAARRGDQEGLPAAGARAAPGRQQARPRGRGEVQGGRRGLRGALRPRPPPHLRHLRPRGPALAAAGPRGLTPSAASRTCCRPSSAAATRCSASCSASARAGPAAGGDVGRPGRGEPRGGAHRGLPGGLLRGGLDLRALPGQRRRAGDADSHLRDLRRQRRAARGGPYRVRAAGAHRACPTCGGQGRVPETPCEECGGEGRTVRTRDLGGRGAARGSSRVSGSGSPARATPARAAGRPGDLYVEVVVADDERFERHGQDLVIGRRDARDPGDARRHGRPSRRSTASARSRSPRGRSPASTWSLRGLGLPSLRGGAGATSTWCSDVYVPAELSDEQRELVEQLDESLESGEPARATGDRRWRRRAAPRARLIRLAVRCRPELAERVLAELVELAPGGVEEERGWTTSSTRSTARPGELPDRSRPAAVAGGGAGRGHLDRGPRRLGRPLAGLPRAAPGRRAALGAPVVGASPARGRSTW